MRIDEQTSQQELRLLYRQVVQREARRDSPLNLRLFPRYAVLFILFPGMVCGFRAGLALTSIFSLLLVGLLLAGMEAWGTAAVGCWFALGVAILVGVCLNVQRSARLIRIQRLQERPTDGSANRSCLHPRQKSLHWQRLQERSGRFHASLHLEAPVGGIYALLLTVDHKGGCRMVTPDRVGMCVVESEGAKGGSFQTLLLYHLAAGFHRLSWMADTPDGRPPHGEVTQLNRVAAEG